MRKSDFISGVFLFIFSVVLFFQTKGLTIWGDLGPSEGFFPLLLSVLLGFLSLLIILKTWLIKKEPQESVEILGANKGKLFLYFASFLLFGLIFKTIGYSLTLTAFFIFILKILEKQSWKLTIVVTVVSIAVSHVMFIVFLSVPLPEGFLTTLLQKIK
jgi:putative tricarboxylic transport membrane protein